jgi:hypothetical protein
MQKTSTINNQKGLSIFFVLLPFFAIANEDPFFDDTDDITPVASIDNYIPLVLVIVIYFTYRYFKTQHSLKTKKIIN